MLFDLRGRGRRRTVQGIYLGLAILIGGGLVLFGVGGAGIGLLNSSNNNGAGGGNPVAGQLKAAERAVRTHPNDPAAWAELARRRYQNADFNNATQKFTPQGMQQLRAASAAWKHYLAMNPKNPDSDVAHLMTNAYAQDALRQPADAVTAWEIVTQQDPTSANYSQLAVEAYLAGQTRKGDLAANKAVELAPKPNQATLKAQLAQLKKQAQSSAASGTSPGG